MGLIVSERFINMPSQIIPPTYKMLLEEMRWALEEGEPYNFTHFLVLSKTYVEIDSKLDQEEDRPNKKKKKSGGGGSALKTFYFHPEDEVLQQHAVGHGNFEYTKQAEEGASDAKRAFQDAGIKPMGHMILIEADRFEGAVRAVEEYLGS